jgi:molybdopterin converting factor subunit 1
LINADSLLLDLPDTRALDNVNTSDEYRSAAAAFGGPASSVATPTHPPSSPDQKGGDPHLASPAHSSSGAGRASSPGQHGEVQLTNAAALEAKARSTDSKPRTLRIQYYAILREQAGRSEETLDTTAATPAELYDELRKRHPFQLNSTQLKVALNNDFSDWNTPLRHGDTVVFIPPVAGG